MLSAYSKLPSVTPVAASLLPLNRRRRLARDVIDDARDTGNLVHDAAGDVFEKLVGQARPLGSHEGDRRNGTQGDNVVVTPRITQHSNRAHRKKDSEGLARLVVQVVLA